MRILASLACPVNNFVKDGRKIVGAATNYLPVLKINKMPTPTKPGIFLKPTSSYIVEGQEIVIPEGFTVNQEIELGVIIAEKCKNISVEKAMKYVAGYCLALDMTATCQMKEARKKGESWLIGKGFDTACPVSKFIPKKAIPDPHNVKLWCHVNGLLRQEGSTRDLIFEIPFLMAYISKFITLEPNDLLLTGTPPGMSPIGAGDVIEGGINDGCKDIITIKFDVTC